MTSPGGDLHEIIAAGQSPTEAQHENIDQVVFEVEALAPWIGDSLQPLHEFAHLLGHRMSFRSVQEPTRNLGPNSFVILILKCVCPGLRAGRLRSPGTPQS